MTRSLTMLCLLLSACEPTKVGETGGELVETGEEQWVDGDGDGYTANVDCNDRDAMVNPGMEDTPDDGIDQDCDDVDATASSAGVDADGDGYLETVDCDDADATINPGAEDGSEDGIDQDCDETDGPGGGGSTSTDADGDGYPDTVDCDDTDASVNPGASETWYDGTDQDCDGADDDQDADGYALADDCDDEDALVFPGADEVIGDGADQDCDGVDTVGVDALSAGDLIITEIMNKPDVVADDYGEWIEVYNASGGPVDLDGLEVSATSAALTFTIEGALLVPEGGYAVLVRDADDAVNGGVPWDYDYRSDLALDNSAETLTLSYDGEALDAVAYDDQSFFPDDDGHAMSLDVDHLDPSDNDQGQYWCAATSSYGDGDLGTPGEENDACDGMGDGDDDGWVEAHDCDDDSASTFPGASETARDGLDQNCDGADGDASSLRSGEFLIVEVLQNPDAVDDDVGEWFELYNNTSYSWNLNGLSVRDATGEESFAVDQDIVVASHAYIVFAINDDPDENGGVVDIAFDYPGSTFGLGNGSDGIYLYSAESSGTLIDSVDWDNGDDFPDPTGASMSLKSSGFSASGNNSGSAWCTSTSYIADDDANDRGTPAESNDRC